MFFASIIFFSGAANSAECIFEQSKLEKTGRYYVLKANEVGVAERYRVLSSREAELIVSNREPTFTCSATNIDGFDYSPVGGGKNYSLGARGYGKISCRSRLIYKAWDPYKIPKPFQQPMGCSTTFMFTPWEQKLASRFFVLVDDLGNQMLFDNPNRTAFRSEGVLVGPAGAFESPNPFSPPCDSDKAAAQETYKKLNIYRGIHAPINFGKSPYFKEGAVWTNRKNSYAIQVNSEQDVEQCRTEKISIATLQKLSTYQVLDTISELAVSRRLDEYGPSEISRFRGRVSEELFDLATSAMSRHNKYFLLAIENEGPYSLIEDDTAVVPRSTDPNF